MASQRSSIRATKWSFCCQADVGFAAEERLLQIALLQYREGILDFTTNKAKIFTNAKITLSLPQGGVALGLITTYRALGGGWQIREGRDFVPLETQPERCRSDQTRSPDPRLTASRCPGLPSPRTAASGPTAGMVRIRGMRDWVANVLIVREPGHNGFA